MKKVFCGTSGSDVMPSTHQLSEIVIRSEIVQAFTTFYGQDLTLRPAQDEALFNYNLLNNSDNTIIATPTNSGKSLLSYLLLFKDAIEGKTVVLVEPLRALAYEKSEELKKIADIIKQQYKIKIKITITTGDYRLTDEFMRTKPEQPDGTCQGQIIVATPERLDAISRINENRDWFRNVSLICFDEAHLIGDQHRGAALELLIAYLRSLKTSMRLVLMSATISNSDELAEWLNPCSVISDIPRYPTLDKWVYCVDDGEEVNDIILQEIKSILETPTNSVVIFVYQTASAESLAHFLATNLSGRRIKPHDLEATMASGVAWFHSKLSTATKESIITAMTSSRIRVAVSTTALSMGINLPATHVFVRDVVFTGHKDLDVSDLMQMLGRAGRGNNKGTGVVFLAKTILSKASTTISGLENETVPHVSSQLIPSVREDYYGASGDDMNYIDRVGNQVMGIINRCGNITLSGFQEYLTYTLGGNRFENLPVILRYLSQWKLAFLNEDTGEYELTHLGRVASQCYLPPITAANTGQLIRDLLSDRPNGVHISSFAPIDFLIMLCLISSENKPIVRYTKAIRKKITEYMENLPLEEKSYLYHSWIIAAPEEIYGSACVVRSVADPNKYVYQCTFTAMLIYDISRGLSQAQLNERYKIDVEEVQEKLRDNALWILCGLEKIMELRSFYFHLKSNCEADVDQIRQVELAFKKASKTIFSVVANLKYRSHLGELVRSIKRVYPHADSYPGEGTLRKLELASITSIKDLIGKTPEDLVALGIKRTYADLIVGYVKKRLS